MIKFGYAETDITPEKSIELMGFNREDNWSKGVLKPLYAQVSVWESEERSCLIAIDSIGFKVELADKLRMEVADQLKISTDRVMLCFSHCHSAPNVDEHFEYFTLVCEKVFLAVNAAVRDMKPVAVGWDNVEVNIGVNRREDNENIDNRAGVLKVCDANNDETQLILVRLTAHCNVLKRDNFMVSPDYFGNVREVLQENCKCPVMVIQGAAGNIAPKYFSSNINPMDARGPQYVRSQKALDEMAAAVCDKIIPIISNINMAVDLSAVMFSKNIVLYANVPSIEEAEKVMKEAYDDCGIDGSAWQMETERLRSAGIEKQGETVEVQYFKIGEWCICGVPFELMVEFALDAKQRLKNEFFYVNGYTNGCSSYFPTEEEFDKGGYEVHWAMLIYFQYYNRVFPFERSSAAKLMDFIVKNAKVYTSKSF